MLLRNVDFSKIKDSGNTNPDPPLPQSMRPTWIKFGAESGNPFLGMVVTFDDSLCGGFLKPCPFKAVLPKYSTHLLNLPGKPCQATMKPWLIPGNNGSMVGFLPLNSSGDWSRRFYNGITCTVQTRRLTIYGQAQNTSVNPVDLVLIPPGKTIDDGFYMQWTAFGRAYNKDQGDCPWAGRPCDMGTEAPVSEPRRFAEGYGAAIIPSEYFSANQPWRLVRADGKPIDTTKLTMVEFSDVMFDGNMLPGPDTVQISMNNRLCLLKSTDPRRFMGQYGATRRIESGGSCVNEWLRAPLLQLPPSPSPTRFPTTFPSRLPTKFPTKAPTKFPTKFPTKAPTKFPTSFPAKGKK